MKTRSLLGLMVILITGCIYRVDIPQGIVVTPEQIRQIQPGMSRKQVESILGSPILTNVFHTNRIDYYRYLIPGSNKVKKPFQKDTVIYYNQNNEVVSIKNRNFRTATTKQRYKSL